MTPLIERSLERSARLSHRISACVVLPAMVVLLGTDVVLRYAFSAPLYWVQETCSLLLFIALVLALSSCWLKGLHVRMEMFYEIVPFRWKSVSDVLTAICGLILFGMLGWQAFRDIPYMLATSESSEELGVLLWPFRLLLALVSTQICLQLLLFLRRSVRGVFVEDTHHGKP